MTELELPSDLTPIEKPFSYLGKDYIVTEASGDAAVKYRNALLKSARNPDSKTGMPTSIDGMADAEPILVQACVFEVTANGRGKVSEGWVRSLPNRLLKPLFNWIMDNSELKEKEVEAPKADTPSMTTGSV